MVELSREDKKIQQLIALIEKQDQEQKRKQEKKKQQELNQQQQVLKKSQSVVVAPTVKQKPKINISFAPGALQQNARYMHQQKLSIEKSSVNWYSWGRDLDINQSKVRDTLEEGDITTYEPTKRQKLDSNGKDKVISTNGTPDSINDQTQIIIQEQTQPTLQKREIHPSSENIEDSKSDHYQKIVNETGLYVEDETLRIFEATQKVQTQMRLKYLPSNPQYSDQLYVNLQQGKSLRAALLISSRTKTLQHQNQTRGF